MSAQPPTERLAIELAALRDEVAALRAELRAALRKQHAGPALVAAIEEYFGTSRFTAAMLLALAEDEPHSAMADALADMIDMNAAPRSRATQLGARLSRMAEIEVVAKQHGCAVYRLT